MKRGGRRPPTPPTHPRLFCLTTPPPPPAIFTLGGLGHIFVQQRLTPELPRATRPHQGAHKRTDIFRLFFLSPGCPKSRPSWGLDLSTPCPFGGLGPNLCSTKIAPRASHGHRTSPRSPQEPQHFNKKFRKKSRTELRSQNLIFWILIAPHGSPWFPMGPRGPRDPQGPPKTDFNPIFQKFRKL